MNPPPYVPGGSSLPPSNLPGGSGSQGMPPSNVPSGGGLQGMPPMSAPPAKAGGGLFTTRNIIIGLIVLLFLCCCCGVIGIFVYRGLQQQASTIISDFGTLVPDQGRVALAGTDFMNKLKSSDWAGAYSNCTPTLQTELGSAAALGKRLTDGKVQPVSWTFATFAPVTPSTQEAQIDGTAAFANGTSGSVRLVLDRAGSGWQISGFNLTPK
jgi:hypothetical protein